MLSFHWFSSLKNQHRPSRNFRARRNQHHRNRTLFTQTSVSRNVIEALEDRTLLTAFTVVNTNDSGIGSLREAIELANANAGADTISFDAALAGQTIVLTDELLISDDLTIDGLGADQLILDGNGDSRIFNIDDGDWETTINVTINGLTLTNGYADYGGAIRNSENLSLADSTISNNEASRNGGGVYNIYFDRLSIVASVNTATDSGSDPENNFNPGLLIANSTFSGNTALSGGGIYNLDGQMKLKGTSLSNNSATSSGGGIYNKGILEIEESTLSGNAANYGGGIHHHSGKITIANSTISGNTASLFGGGIYSGYTVIPISPPVYNPILIYSNSIPDSSSSTSLNQLDSSHDEFTNTALSTNDSANNYLQDYVILLPNTIIITNSTITGNSAGISGGGINESHSVWPLQMVITNSLIVGNTAENFHQITGAYTNNTNIIQDSVEGLLDPVLRDNGGPTKTHALLTGSAAINAGDNAAANDSGLTSDQRGSGYDRIFDGNIDIGAFEFNGYSLVVDTLVDEADGDYSSGNLSLREAINLANASVDADTITFNSSLAGQTIVLNNQLRITDDLTIIGLGADRLTIDANHNGRIFDVYDGTHIANIYVEISGLTLANGNGTIIPDLANTTPSVSSGGQISYKNYPNGGAIFNKEFLTVSDLILRDNKALNGGAIFTASSATAKTSIENTIFLRNEASTGGAIYSASQTTVINSSFVENKASNDGGAIFASLLTVTGSSFTGNIAMDSGGAIYHKSGDMNISDCTFYRNVATLNGGGIYNSYRQGWGFEEVTITDGPIAGLKIRSVVPTYNFVAITNSDFIENSASSGGGIYSVQLSPQTHPAFYSFINPNQNVEVDVVSDFENDFDPKILISDSSFSGNTAQNGAGIRNYSGEMKVEGSRFSENSVTGSGGGLHNSGSLLIEASTLSGNTANLGGGYFNSGNLLLKASTLSGNTAGYGGGVYSRKGELTMHNSTISGNRAGIMGGGIYSGPLTLNETGFVNSVVQDFTQATFNSLNAVEFVISDTLDSLNIDDSTIVITNSTITGNSAEQSGGGIASHPDYNQYTTTTITNSIIAGNKADSSAQVEGTFDSHSNIIQDSIEGIFDPVLRDNGGPTKTHALLAGSVAINAGNNDAANDAGLTNDQRGTGYKRVFDGTVDIGAYEFDEYFLIVDTTSDLDDGDYSSGQLSLREAIRLANERPNTDTITFAATLAGQTIVINSELLISDHLTITGLGADLLTLDGNNNSRIFSIFDGTHNIHSINVEITGLTLTNGFSEKTGGAILNSENLSLSNVSFINNKSMGSGGAIGGSTGTISVTNSYFLANSASSNGGAIYSGFVGSLFISTSQFVSNSSSNGGGVYVNGYGQLSIKNSNFVANSASLEGGGIYNTGVFLIEGTTISGNTALQGGGISHFQGRSLRYPNGFSSIGEGVLKNSTITNNTATDHGGGINNSGNLSIINSTLSGNHSGGIGGAISQTIVKLTRYNSSRNTNHFPLPISTLTESIAADWSYITYIPNYLKIRNSTITGNSAVQSGGGIATLPNSNQFTSTTVTITNSIVAGNTAVTLPQIEGKYIGNSNIIQDSIDGLLDPILRDNGGPTKTHALLAGSAAINAGNNDATNAAGLTNDQRGTGSARIVDGTVDIGAFEVQGPFTQIDLRVVNSKTPTSINGERTSLPENLTWIDEWGNYWVEIWISTPTTSDLGILSANLNFTYNTDITTATYIEYGSAFTENQTGFINDLTGTIENLSAETSLTDVGDDQSVLFARIKFESINDDAIDLDLEGQSLNPQNPEFSISRPEITFVDGSPSEEVHGTSPETQTYANPYDLNDDNEIDFDDLTVFISAYNSVLGVSGSNYNWLADFDKNAEVNFQDLVLFIRNYDKTKLNQSPIFYPDRFLESWNNPLTVNAQTEPQPEAEAITQSTAETVLEDVVEQVSPELTADEVKTLENTEIQVVDLQDDLLGRAVPGTIYIDVNAAGYGWFVDSTPGEHSEFEHESQLSLIALPDSEAAGKIDLWTVIMHEVGHILGHEHEDEGIMEETLAPGVRKLPFFTENDHSLHSENETDEFFTSLKDDSNLIAF